MTAPLPELIGRTAVRFISSNDRARARDGVFGLFFSRLKAGPAAQDGKKLPAIAAAGAGSRFSVAGETVQAGARLR
jgi:hypothetical protein